MTSSQLREPMHVTTRFTTSREALVPAISIASTVPPQALTRQAGSGGALCVVECREGQGIGSIYCRGESMVSRGMFTIEEVNQEGRFVFPARHLRMFDRLPKGDRVTVEAGAEGDDHRVCFRSGQGARYEHRTYDPRLIAACERDLASACETATIHSTVMAHGVRTLRPFIPENDDMFLPDRADAIRAVPDGRLIALSGTKLATFATPALRGAQFTVRSDQISPLLSFLRKANGTLSVRTAQTVTYLVTGEGHAFGWAHRATPATGPNTYAEALDEVVVRVSRDALIGRLETLVQATGSKRRHVRVEVERETLRLTVEGWDVPVPLTAPRSGGGIAFQVELRDLHLVVASTGHAEIELRIATARGRTWTVAVVRTCETIPLRAGRRRVPEAESALVTRHIIGIHVDLSRPESRQE